MSIPIHLQQFKAAGIYRVVFDKSTIVNYDTELLRLVVGYSEQGPFNTPVYVKDPQTFTAMFGGINKKLEKRGIFFHRLALQMLQVSPCLVLNLKKFNGEVVGGASISSDFNPSGDTIDTVTLNVEDIYDTTRFWTLDAEKLNGLRDVDGKTMDQYINICTTNTKKTSATVFIRKASGLKVSGYNITVNDWYSDNPNAMPEFLEKFKNNLITDFFAEVYVFNGEFTPKQVLASDTLKNYFVVENKGTDDESKLELKLRDKVYNAFGDPSDTLDALYADETSNALGHYVGALIPEFKTKNNTYAALDIAFNNDIDIHNMMMSFNTELLYESEDANIDLSGRMRIPTAEGIEKKVVANPSLSLDTLFDGTAVTSVLGNIDAPVIADKMTIRTNVAEVVKGEVVPLIPFNKSGKSLTGIFYVTNVTADKIELKQVGSGEEITVNVPKSGFDTAVKKFGVIILKDGIKFTQEEINTAQSPVEGVKFTQEECDEYNTANGLQNGDEGYRTTSDWKVEPVEAGEAYGKTTNDWKVEPTLNTDRGTYWTAGDAFTVDNIMAGPEKVITAITAIESTNTPNVYSDADTNLKTSMMDVQYVTESKYTNTLINDGDSVYGSSVSFIDYQDGNWKWTTSFELIDGVKQPALVCEEAYWDRSLLSILKPGDCLVANDGIVDYNEDDDPSNDADNYHDAVYVQEVGTKYDADGQFVAHYVLLTGQPLKYPGDIDPTRPEIEGANAESTNNQYLVRIDAALNQEIGTMKPLYLEGYTYQLSRPDGTGMWAKLQWQKEILSVLTAYKGLRTGLLNKSEIDYRYVIDTFQSFPDTSIKKELAFLCKEKQSAFCIANFPSVQTFTKCPYASYTDSKGVFNVEYVVKGCNKKKAASISFSLPDDGQGASYIAFYTPLKFSDGYLDSIIPSAGLVSNLFIQKYLTRQPYYIVAGPNYGRVYASGMVGPDYKYSMDELQVIEPFGVNCMVYRPNFGTFINANQTAKQIPLSALSKVHVRELVIYLMDEVEKVLQSYQWEFNNGRTREAILSRANNICARIMANGGLQAYLNIMDESNNTPDIIDNEMAVLSTHIEPGMGCGKMVHELTLYRTGQMQSSIAEA